MKTYAGPWHLHLITSQHQCFRASTEAAAACAGAAMQALRPSRLQYSILAYTVGYLVWPIMGTARKLSHCDRVHPASRDPCLQPWARCPWLQADSRSSKPLTDALLPPWEHAVHPMTRSPCARVAHKLQHEHPTMSRNTPMPQNTPATHQWQLRAQPQTLHSPQLASKQASKQTGIIVLETPGMVASSSWVASSILLPAV
jgi:hypothetical protein